MRSLGSLCDQVMILIIQIKFQHNNSMTNTILLFYRDLEKFDDGYKYETSSLKEEKHKQSVLDERLIALQEKVCIHQTFMQP